MILCSLFTGSVSARETELGQGAIQMSANFKGTVQQDLRGVEDRLKRSVLLNCKTASLYYLIFKEHHHEISKKKRFQHLNNIYIEADQA
jgi:hypothetical protein